MGGVGTWSRENTTLYIGGVVSSDAPAEVCDSTFFASISRTSHLLALLVQKMIYERYSPYGDIVSGKREHLVLMVLEI